MQEIIDYFEKFFLFLRVEKGLSPRSIAYYKGDLEQFLKFIIAHKKNFKDLNFNDLTEYFEHLYANVIAISTHQRKLSTLKSFYKFLQNEGVIEKNSLEDFERPKDERNIPGFLSTSEIETLLNAAKEDNSRSGIRFYAVLELLYSSGMRISEALEMKLEDFDSGRMPDSVIINGKGERERIVFVNKDAKEALKRFLQVRETFMGGQASPYLFANKNTHLSRQNFFISLKKLAYLCKISEQKVSPHKIRHSFATHCYQNGANIRILQEMLGHASISTTEIYTHTRLEDKKRLIEQFHPISKKKRLD